MQIVRNLGQHCLPGSNLMGHLSLIDLKWNTNYTKHHLEAKAQMIIFFGVHAIVSYWLLIVC